MLFDPQKWVMPEVQPEAPQLEPWQKLLLDAAALIEKKGWCRDNFYNRGRYCAIGALNVVSGFEACDPLRLTPARKKAEAKLKGYLKLGDDHMAVEYWNDDHAKSGKAVVAALRGAAKIGGK